MNDRPVNVGETGGEPVFFEIAYLNPYPLVKKLKAIGIDREKVQEWFENVPPGCKSSVKKVLDMLFGEKKGTIILEGYPGMKT